MTREESGGSSTGLAGPKGREVYTSAVLSGPVCAMLNLDWAAVTARAGIDPARARDLGYRISAEEFVRLWVVIVEMSAAKHLAKRLALRIASGPAIPVLFALSTAPDFETGLARLSRYKHIFGPMRFGITRPRNRFNVIVLPDAAEVTLPGTFSSAQIIYLHAKAVAMAVRRFSPVEVSLPLPLGEREELADLFGVVPADGPPSLSYARPDVSIPFVSPNEALWTATERDLQSQALIMSRDASVSHRVRATLLESFANTDPVMDHVCARLGMSKSTLLRRLRDEGTTFQALRDATRTELAERYLRTSDLSNQQIAHLVGYRDTSAFQRAFRKWTGRTPLQVRAAFTGGAGDPAHQREEAGR